MRQARRLLVAASTAEALAISRLTPASSDAYFVGTLDPSRIASVSFLPIRSQSESVHILSPAPANIAAVLSSKSCMSVMKSSHSVSATKLAESFSAWLSRSLFASLSPLGVARSNRAPPHYQEFLIMRVGATHREMRLRRSRQVGRGRRPSREAVARARATKPSEANAEASRPRLRRVYIFHLSGRDAHSPSEPR